MKYFNKICASILLLVLLLSTFTVSAKEVEYAPYSGYEYDSNSQSISAPITYLNDRNLDYADMGVATPLSSPTDIYWNGTDLYLLDSGNSRILVLDSSLKLVKERNSFKDQDGNAVTFTGAQGFAVTKDGNIYIADTENQRILLFDESDILVLVIDKPDESEVGFSYTFDVSKVCINPQGLIYAVASNVNSGIFTFDKNGAFQYFYGRGTVVKTVDVILNYFKKQFMTREQIQKQMNQTSATISNFDIDSEGFVYTVSKQTKAEQVTVSKLNFKGANILKTEGINSGYGDLEWDRMAASVATEFVDVDVDNAGFVFYLDSGRARVFQYTTEGQMIGSFGGYGYQTGTFQNPVAIETIGDKVIVLDANEGSLTVFKPTEYAVLLRNAFLDLDTSDPQKSLDAWNEVLKHNTNSQFPYYGLGMAYEKLGNYKEAMECFKRSNSKSEYSDAFSEYRKQYVKDKLPLIGIVAVVFVVALAAVLIIKKRRKTAEVTVAYSKLESKYGFPLYVLFHPADGFAQFKYRSDLPSLLMSFIIVGVAFLISFISYFATGFAFNGNDPEDYTIISTLISSVVVYALFVIGNWAVCSLLSGNGKMKEICSVTAYAAIPYLIGQIINVILSNVLTLNESMALTIVSIVCVIWSILVLLIGLSEIHQYYIGKTVLTILLTLFAMIVIALISFLFFSLISQMVSFVQSIISELQLRF